MLTGEASGRLAASEADGPGAMPVPKIQGRCVSPFKTRKVAMTLVNLTSPGLLVSGCQAAMGPLTFIAQGLIEADLSTSWGLLARSRPLLQR